MIEIFERSENIFGLMGIVIAGSLWAVRKAFYAQSEIFSKELEFLKEKVGKLADLPSQIWGIHTALEVHKNETNGMLERIESILKEQATETKAAEIKLAQIEAGYAKARKKIKRRKVRNGI